MKKEDILQQFYDGSTQQWDLELDDIALIPAIYDELASMKQKYILTMQATAQYCRIEIRKGTYDLGDDPVCYVNESLLNYLCKKAVSIGIDSYEELGNEKFYCVDKTRMIEEFLLSGDKVTLNIKYEYAGSIF